MKIIALALACLTLATACTKPEKGNEITIGFNPAENADVVESNGKVFSAFYEKHTGARVKTFIATDYTALIEEQDYSPIRPLVDWLDYNGYTMVTKPLREYTDSSGRRRIKGNTDIELAVDVLELASKLDHIVLFSGDGDFKCVVEAAQRKGVRVTVVSTIRTNPPMVSDDLRRQADNFIDLKDIMPYIMRDPASRPTTFDEQPDMELDQDDVSIKEKIAELPQQGAA